MPRPVGLRFLSAPTALLMLPLHQADQHGAQRGPTARDRSKGDHVFDGIVRSVSSQRHTFARCLIAAASCAPLTALATNYTGVLTTAIGIPLLLTSAGLLLALLIVRTQARPWLMWLATLLALAVLLAGVWVFQMDTWRLWPYASDSQRVAKGTMVAVYCALWLAVLVQTCLLWILRPRRTQAH